jgi:hypothetical protein
MLQAKRRERCGVCREWIGRGDWITWIQGAGVFHPQCVTVKPAAQQHRERLAQIEKDMRAHWTAREREAKAAAKAAAKAEAEAERQAAPLPFASAGSDDVDLDELFKG